jgi:phosphomannomutase
LNRGITLAALPEYRRYCPGEEQIKISDAICIGRRRANFMKCRGCQFNDNERNVTRGAVLPTADRTAEAAERARRERVESVFGSYDVRGIYPDPLDADVAWRVGHAVAQFLRSELRGYDRGRPEKAAVVVGRDMRKSGPDLLESLIQGLRAGGSPVIDIGMIDTPQMYFAANHLTCCGGVQVTASHNAGQYNGFKTCGQKGKPVGTETGLGKISKIAVNTIRHTTGQPAGYQQQDLTEPYRQFVRGFLRTPAGYTAEHPFRLVVDASNGMAGRWLPLVFGDVEWLEIIRLNFEHNGEFVHDPNPLVTDNLTQLQDRMLRSNAHAGVCFDGDADRCVFVDEAGHAVRADIMTALMARYFLRESAGSAVVYDLRCSRVVPEEIRKAGGSPRRERCGHTYMKKAMADCRGVFGGELSGHYYFRDNWFCDSGLIALAEVLNILTETCQPLSELVAPLDRYAHSGERNFKNDKPEDVMRWLADKYSDGEIDYLDGLTVQYPDWWFNVRRSNTEPLLRLNVEAADAESLERKLAEITPRLGAPVSK